MKRRTRFLVTTFPVLLLFTVLGGCGEPSPQRCQRYDALSLNHENGFAARLDWPRSSLVDLAGERVEVALNVVRPLHGPVELVHLVGDTEADTWTLQIPDPNRAPVSLCTIGVTAAQSNCGAVISHPPLSPAGYYYLRAGDNTVFEAGLSFFLCE